MTLRKTSFSRRRLAVLLGLSLASVTPVALSQSVSAASQFDPPVTLGAPRPMNVREFRTNWVRPFTITGTSTAPVVVAITMPESTRGTTFTVRRTTGAALNFGYSSFENVQSVAFTSSVASARMALESLLINSGEPGKVTLAVTVTLDETRVVYEPETTHFYEFVPSAGITWQNALTAASQKTFRGVSGSLAAIETANENDFIAANIAGASNVWIGGTDRDNEGEFKWVTGPSAGTTFWKARCAANPAGSADSCTGANNIVAGGQANGVYKDGVIDNPLVNTFSSWDSDTKEPNNWGGANQLQGGENFVATNWNGTSGLWNDLPASTSSISGYLVEYPTTPGQPFVGVLRQSVSLNVVAETSAYRPTNVKVAPTANPGEYTVTWGEPQAFRTRFFASFKTKASAARARANFRSYLVGSQSNESRYLSGCVVTRSQARSCTISGFKNGVEPVVSVVARYERHPGQNPRDRKPRPGRTTFAAYGKSASSTAPVYVQFAGRPGVVNSRSAMIVQATGLAPNTAWTLKNTANGRTVASGTTSTTGAVAPVRTTFPVIDSLGTNIMQDFRQVTLEFAYVDAAGQAKTQPYSVLLYAVLSPDNKVVTLFREITPQPRYRYFASRLWTVSEVVEPRAVDNWPAS